MNPPIDSLCHKVKTLSLAGNTDILPESYCKGNAKSILFSEGGTESLIHPLSLKVIGNLVYIYLRNQCREDRKLLFRYQFLHL